MENKPTVARRGQQNQAVPAGGSHDSVADAMAICVPGDQDHKGRSPEKVYLKWKRRFEERDFLPKKWPERLFWTFQEQSPGATEVREL